MAKPVPTGRSVAQNRRARYDYAIEDTLEAGLVLTRSEVKSLRHAQASINEAYAGPDNGKLKLFNANIPEYGQAGRFNHEPKRPRELLVHRRERERRAERARRDARDRERARRARAPAHSRAIARGS